MTQNDIPLPKISVQFRKAARALTKSQLDTELSDKCATSGSTKSYAQVETLVLPPKSGALKRGSTSGKHRTTPFAVRLSKEQKDIVRAKAKAANYNVNEYIRMAVLGPNYATTLDPNKHRHLQDAYRELSRQGNNLNQLARRLNAGFISPEEAVIELSDLAPHLIAAYDGIRRALAEGRSAE